MKLWDTQLVSQGTAGCEEKPPHIWWPNGKCLVWVVKETRTQERETRRRGRRQVSPYRMKERLSKQNTKDVQRHNARRDISSVIGVLMWKHNDRMDRVYWTTRYMREGWVESEKTLGKERQFPEQDRDWTVRCTRSLCRRPSTWLCVWQGRAGRGGAQVSTPRPKVKKLNNVLHNYALLWKHLTLDNQNSNYITSSLYNPQSTVIHMQTHNWVILLTI